MCEQRRLHQFADDMAHHDMRLLDAGGIGGGHVEAEVGQLLHLATATAGQRHGLDAHFAGLLKGIDDILRVAGSGDAHQHIACVAGASEQPGEDMFKAIVVTHGGQIGGIAVQGLGIQGRTVEVETAGEFGGQMLGVGRAAAVATEVDLALIAQRGTHHIGHGLNFLNKGYILQYQLFNLNTLFNGADDSVCHFMLVFWGAKLLKKWRQRRCGRFLLHRSGLFIGNKQLRLYLHTVKRKKFLPQVLERSSKMIDCVINDEEAVVIAIALPDANG